MRFYYKEKGIQPVPPWNEKQFSVTTLSGVLDQYIPPEGDGKLSPLNTEVKFKKKMELIFILFILIYIFTYHYHNVMIICNI